MPKINDPQHLNSSSADKNVTRGIVYSDGYYIWNGSAWISYGGTLNYLPLSGGRLTGAITGTFSGDGSGLSGVAATASVD